MRPSVSPNGVRRPMIVGRCSMMRRCMETLRRAAATDSRVLILGESGTGKELAARTIHERSARAKAPFVAVNGAALPETLFESELFGHESGAFTGAGRRRTGHFERARGGTLFLDEVGDLPASLQVKLLRVIEEGEVLPVGGERVIAVDVRVIAATNRDLRRAVADGRFREDLYYRLAVLTVSLPPLRERHDLGDLVEHFLTVLAAEAGRAPPALAPDVMERFRAHSWPGNVRMLRNVIEHATVMCDGDVIEEQHLPEDFLRHLPHAADGAPAARPSTSIPTYKEAERELIRRALEETRGNRTMAARLLGISRNTITRKLNEHGLGAHDFGARD